MIRTNSVLREISGSSSFFLDFIRISAAIVVLVFHLYIHWLPDHINTIWLDKLAHTGVVIFFVLSGYVIAYTTLKNNRGGMHYFVARLSRLYSVVAPALIICAVCQLIIYFTNPAVYEHITRGASWPRYIMSGLFVNEIWLFSAAPPINLPLWSLSFEFWYYIIFGFFIYRGKGLKWILPCVIACVIAGPKILLMMPIWLFGYFAYKVPTIIVKTKFCWLIVFIMLVTAILFSLITSPMPHKIGTLPFLYASQFVTDWITGIFVAISLWALPSVARVTKENPFITKFRIVADLTFPIYILHTPLMILFDSIFKPQIVDQGQLLMPFLIILISTGIIGLFIERYRFLTLNFFKNIFSYFTAYKFKASVVQGR